MSTAGQRPGPQSPVPPVPPVPPGETPASALLRRAYAHLPLSLTFSVVALAVFVGLLQRYFTLPVFTVWMGLMALAVLVRAGSWWAYRRRGWPAGTEAPAAWHGLFMAGALVSSLCWSFGPTWHLAATEAPGAAVMAGALLIVCAAAVPAMAAHPRSLMLFLVGAMAPPALAAGLRGDVHSQILALELGFGLGVMLLAARRNGNTLAAQIRTQVELQHAAAQAEAMRAQAESASLAKTRFLANMSHELRTPLNAVIGAAQLLRAEAADAERQGPLVEAIQQGGRNLLGLIENILDLSRIEAGALALHAADFDLVDCVEAALSTAALSARAKGLALACVVDPALPAWRHGDAARLRQVLLNLLGNAVKFTPRGEVVLRVQPGAVPHTVRLSVSDTGVGIPAETLARVFEPFRQGDEGADRRFGGSGLGLAIVHQLVQAMGGQVQVRSRPGLGSSFTLELPLPPVPAPHSAPHSAPHASPISAPLPAQPGDVPTRGQRVAFVEPHEASAEALQALLQRLGCDSCRCRDGASLRTWLAQAGPGAPPAWLLLASDAPDADELLAAAIDWVEPERVISLAAEFSLEAGAARDSLRMASELLKPVTRAALAGRLGARTPAALPADASTAPVPPALLTSDAYERLTHVMVVEDDALNRAIVSGLLAHAGCRVTEAADGPQALARLAAAQRVDLVLMDWQMPGMDGLEVTRRLRQGEAGAAGRRVPIVALTANAFAEDRAACLAAGMNDFLTKPVLATALLAAVARWAPAAAAPSAPPAPSAPSAPSAPAHPPAPLAEAIPATPAAPPVDTADPPATDGPPVFDAAVLAALPMVADGSAPEVVDELLAMFERTGAEALRDIGRALADADLPCLQRLVHTLKSTSASVGALELAALAAAAEAGLRRGEPPAADLHGRLVAAWRRLRPHLPAAAAALETPP